MKIAFGCDHGGFPAKDELLNYLTKKGTILVQISFVVKYDSSVLLNHSIYSSINSINGSSPMILSPVSGSTYSPVSGSTA